MGWPGDLGNLKDFHQNTFLALKEAADESEEILWSETMDTSSLLID